MSLLFQGILTGIMLSFMIGPLLFAIIQASLERGFRAGFSVGLGIWLSDVLFIFLIFNSLEWIAALTDTSSFHHYAGLFGGLVLLVFGIGSLMMVKKNVDYDNLSQKLQVGDRALDKVDGKEREGVVNNWRNWGTVGYFCRGFFLNFFNPFTIFFWIGISTTLVIPNHWNGQETVIFFGGMMLTLVITDTMKVFGAKWIKENLNPKQIYRMKLSIGLILTAIGIFALYRTFFGAWL